MGGGGGEEEATSVKKGKDVGCILLSLKMISYKGQLTD